jgi:hypothetical protein
LRQKIDRDAPAAGLEHDPESMKRFSEQIVL